MPEKLPKGSIVGVSGPVVTAEANFPVRLFEAVSLGRLGLLGEVAGVRGAQVDIQACEDTAGLSAGEEVLFTGKPFGVDLGPGLLGEILDALGRPLRALSKNGIYLGRGQCPSVAGSGKLWHFKPRAAAGQPLVPGDVLGTVAEGRDFLHEVLVPSAPADFPSAVTWIASEGDYAASDCVCRLANGSHMTLTQRWPLRVPRPFGARLPLDRPLITGQRALDTLFPLPLGGVALLTGESGTGKTVASRSIAKECDADVVVAVGCGERGSEIAETIEEFSRFPAGGGTPLAERAVFVAIPSNAPEGAREVGVHLGMTLAEYYRDMGRNVLVALDSTSRWAEAVRSISGWLGESLCEEGYPASLGGRISRLCQRAGRVVTLGCSPRRGSVTLIHTVSPERGDFSEPVTQMALRSSGAVWALDKKLARARFFPALDVRRSYSLYADALSDAAAPNAVTKGTEKDPRKDPEKEKRLTETPEIFLRQARDLLPSAKPAMTPPRRLYREGLRGIKGVTGPLLFVENTEGVGCGELVTLETSTETRMGQVLEVKNDLCVIRLFDDTFGLEIGLETGRAKVWTEHDVMRIGVGESLRGRILNGRGSPVDGGVYCGLEDFLPVNGMPLNPVSRAAPGEFIETGLSVLDLINPLACGQRLSLFGGPGLPMDEIAAQIATQAVIPGKEGSFLVVFAGMGLSSREADAFMEAFSASGVMDGGVFLLNKADDPVGERLLTPRAALTIAEYFAFVKGYDVLVVMTDMLRYCEALREIGAARKEPSGHLGYPLSMGFDLAELYERAGCLAKRPGSLTQISAALLPNDDLSHPVAGLSRTLTDAQIVLDRRLHTLGVFPPVDVPASLSRTMTQGTGRDWTFDLRQTLAAQLCDAYGKALELGHLQTASGDGNFSDAEKRYLNFGSAFEKLFVAQGRGRKFERRTLAQSEAKAWEILGEFSPEDLDRLPQQLKAGRIP